MHHVSCRNRGTKCASIHSSSYKQSRTHWGGRSPSCLKVTRPFTTVAWWVARLCQPVSRPGTVLVCLANITLTERREGGTGNPCRSVTGTKWCLPSRVLTCKQAKSQDTSELSWRMGRQLSSVTGPVDLEDHRSLHTQSFRNRPAQKSGRYI